MKEYAEAVLNDDKARQRILEGGPQEIANFANLVKESNDQDLKNGYAKAVLNDDKARQTILEGGSQEIANFANLVKESNDQNLKNGYAKAVLNDDKARQTILKGETQDIANFGTFLTTLRGEDFYIVLDYLEELLPAFKPVFRGNNADRLQANNFVNKVREDAYQRFKKQPSTSTLLATAELIRPGDALTTDYKNGPRQPSTSTLLATAELIRPGDALTTDYMDNSPY